MEDRDDYIRRLALQRIAMRRRIGRYRGIALGLNLLIFVLFVIVYYWRG